MLYQLYNIISDSWPWITLSFIFIASIAVLVYKSKRGRVPNKKEILNEKVDFDNLISSSFHAEKLWDELRKKCHPDRFAADHDKYAAASEIQALINKNKTNLNELLKLKKRAETELGLVFSNH